MNLLKMYPENIIMIDAEKPIDEVYAQTITALERVINSKEETL